jgi:putative membrane protein
MAMMWDFGSGWAPVWMMLMPVLWIGLIVLIVWAVVALVRGGRREAGEGGRQSPEEILDRRFALGEIDAEEYQQAKGILAGQPRSR